MAEEDTQAELPTEAKEGVVEEKRAAREIAPHGPSAAVVIAAQEPGTPIVSRRKVLQVGIFAGLGAAAAGLGACGLANLYPSTVTGFGGTVTVAAADVPPPGGKVQVASGRFWLVNLNAEQGGPGLLALWWKCPHLGCTVPWRPTFIWPDPLTGAPKQGWFRCPCHGSTYTDAGVRVFGPAPRSMDTMAISVDASGRVTINTGAVTPGSPENPDRALRI